MSRYDPAIHHRRSIRLQGYDYTRAGAYFITICTHDRACLFGDVTDEQMQWNECGRLAHAAWEEIPLHFPQVDLDEWVVMPNHVHGIIVLASDPGKTVGTTRAPPGVAAVPRPTDARSTAAWATRASPRRPLGPQCGSIGAVVGSYKSAVSRRINELCRTPGAPVWQRDYYDHIVRSEDELNRIREYIADNPARWADDAEHLENVGNAAIAEEFTPRHR